MSANEITKYHSAPLETLNVAELTDALGVAESASLLGVTARNIYTVRNTGLLGVERIQTLIAAIRKDEANCRNRLVLVRAKRARRGEQKKQINRAKRA